MLKDHNDDDNNNNNNNNNDNNNNNFINIQRGGYSMLTIISWELIMGRDKNRSTRRKTLGVRLRSTNLSRVHEGSGSHSPVVEVRGINDDHFANLTALSSYMGS